jgi:hypothetical protein
MKKMFLTIAATTALWAVVGYAALYFGFFVLLSGEYAAAIDLQTNQMAGAIDQLLQALYACKHAT